jgi:hypothetical protein
MKRGGCSAICRLSGRITVKLVGFRKRMAPSRQCNGTTVEDFPLRGVMNVVLQLRNSGSGTRPHPNSAASFRASSPRVISLAFYKFALPPR